MNRQQLAYFERWAVRYETSPLQRCYFRPVHEAALRHVRRHAPLGARVLDVGCGTGSFLRQARQLLDRPRLYGVDVTSGMVKVAEGIEAARPQGDRAIRFMTATVEQLPFAAESFDVVASTLSFHHWSDQRRGVEEISRVLKPAGLVVLADHFACGWLRPFFATVGKRPMMRTDQEVEAMLWGAGLRTSSWEVAHCLRRLVRQGRGRPRPHVAGPSVPLVFLTTAYGPAAAARCPDQAGTRPSWLTSGDCGQWLP
ncbi:methyltransferase domain-containing protein [Streptomyces sp. NPDC005900]|uniref:class I SAM-dependent methyltransferase n=1 Tax=Streptomyces sp. NPDC005900 TaxID=3154569 RepID=UPI003404FD79